MVGGFCANLFGKMGSLTQRIVSKQENLQKIGWLDSDAKGIPYFKRERIVVVASTLGEH